MPSTDLLAAQDLPIEEFRRRACYSAIKLKYGSTAAFCETIRCSRQMVPNVIAGKYTGGRVAAALAALTGIPMHVLFPRTEKAA